MSNGIGKNPLLDISKVYLESVAESAVPGKPAEKLKTDRAGYSIPKADQMSAAERIKKKTAEKKAALEKKHGMKMDDHPEFPKKKYVDEKLDPVGQEDGDIDNDGDKDSSDKYLMKRRKAIGKAMGKRLKESRSLSEVMTDTEDDKPIKEKKINNKIKINPKLGEAVEELGGTLLEAIEVDEMDYVIESVYDELIEEGFSEDEVEESIETALSSLDEGTVDVEIKDRLKSAAESLLHGEEVEFDEGLSIERRKKAAEIGAKSSSYKTRFAAMKLASGDENEVRGSGNKAAKRAAKVSEAVYGGGQKKELPKPPKDTRMTVTAADKAGNTPAYQRYKAGNKHYKMDEATYPSDFRNPDGSKRAVAKTKDGRPIQHDQPMNGGRRKTVDENRLSDEALEKAAAATQKRHKEQGYKVPGTGAMDDVRARIAAREKKK